MLCLRAHARMTGSNEYGLGYLNLLDWRNTMDSDERRRRLQSQGLAYYMPPWWVSLSACLFYIGVGVLIGVLVAHNSGSHHHHHHDDDDDDSGSGTSSVITEPSAGPFCCTNDAYAFPGSPWASAQPTLCGDYDYNCDGQVDLRACCSGETTFPADRQVFNTSLPGQCQAGVLPQSGQICGACTGADAVTPGWYCSPVPPPLLSGQGHGRKRFTQPCPSSCLSDVEPVRAGRAPALGHCALFVDHCVGEFGGDGTSCCQVVAS